MDRLSLVVRNSISNLIICSYMIAFGVWQYNFGSVYVYNYTEILFPWIAASIVIQLCCFLWIKKVLVYDIGLWFIVLSYFFMYGFLFIDWFNMSVTLLWEPMKSYNQTVLFESTVFVNWCLNLFSLGYLNAYNVNKERLLSNRKKERVADYKKYKIGLLLCVVGGVCQLITSIKLVNVTQAAGDYLAYTEAASTGLIDDISFLFVPGIIYILSSGKLSGKKSLALTGAVVLYFSVIMLLSGSRKTQVFGIVAVVLCYLYNNQLPRFSFIKKLLLVFTGTVFLNMIYTIREYRNTLVEVIPTFFSSLTSLSFMKNLLPETLAETGITFGSVASVIKCVPDAFPHEYGMTVIRSIVSIIPIGWLLPDFFAKATTTTTINEYLNLPVGGSLLADFYWNWGMFGIVAALIFGVVLAIWSSKTRKKSKEVYFSMFYIILIGVRAGLFEITRPLFIVLFVPWVLGYFINVKNQRR